MPSSRNQQPLSTGLGVHFTSPVKPRDKKKTQTIVEVPGHAEKRRRLEEKLAQLRRLKPSNADSPSSPVRPRDTETASEDPFLDVLPDPFLDVLHDDNQVEDTAIGILEPPTAPAEAKKKRLVPDAAAQRLFESWKQLLPTLLEPLLQFLSRTVGFPLPTIAQLESDCTRSCSKKTSPIVCLFFDHFQMMDVVGCACQTIPQVLVKNGLFPTAPLQPRIAVSIPLLDFYRALFEQSCDAVSALASAIHKFYKGRGFRVLDKKGVPVRDPFRRSLAPSIQWYDCLRAEIDAHLDALLLDADCKIQSYKAAGQPESGAGNQEANECSRLLQQRCPACFAGDVFGRPFEEGGDIHVALDGNFHHRHQRNAGDSPHFFDPQYILPKRFVDDIGTHIQSLRGSRPKQHHSCVPDEAVDDCQKTYEAADGRKQKTSLEHFDDSGIMALVCRHDIPLFMANIDSPGEQQKYAIALIQRVFSLLPSNATVVALYDVGCVLDRSIHQYDILPESIVPRLAFRTSAMHAYGHQWACQLVYNPRIQVGTGLTDGEGVERLWSRMRKLIALERSSGRTRRLWLLDRQVSAIGQELRDDLGHWLQRRQRLGVDAQGQKAQDALHDSGIEVPELRRQWESQRGAQLSVRAHAPARLKKELDAVLDLQNDLETINQAIQAARTTITSVGSSAETAEVLVSLERSHSRLMVKVEILYNSLNIPNQFPELKGIDLEFVQTLLLARDLKINIRRRAVGSFFEWERLDQAVGGKAQPLGTKLHQQTRKAISKRKPALTSAIRKFNQYCEKMRAIHKPAWSIPIPQSLPTELSALRDSIELMEDVWISPSQGAVPRWLEDPDVRDGIRAILKHDRCLEEKQRLSVEADNLCRWFGREVAAVELAICSDPSSLLGVVLRQYRERLYLLQQSWTNSFVSAIQFERHITSATSLALELTGIERLPDTAGPAGQDIDFPDVDDSQEAEVPTELDSEETLLLDVIAGDEPEDEDVTEAPVDGCSAVIIWSIPVYITIDSNLLEDLTNTVVCSQTKAPDAMHARMFYHKHGHKTIFGTRELEILRSPTAWLNDVCVNAGAALLQNLLQPTHHPSCAILSTFIFPMVQQNRSNDDLWRNIHRTCYWQCDIWAIPIHRPNHWVLCLVYPYTRQMLLFDSLAARTPWKTDITDVMKLISRLQSLAHCHGHPLDVSPEGWTASPLSLRPTQTTTYDCGLWVLAAIASVLRGRHFTGLSEADMRSLRRRLFRIVCDLPLA